MNTTSDTYVKHTVTQRWMHLLIQQFKCILMHAYGMHIHTHVHIFILYIRTYTLTHELEHLKHKHLVGNDVSLSSGKFTNRSRMVRERSVTSLRNLLGSN